MSESYDPLSRGQELPAFHVWARENALNYSIHYSEAENVWEVEVDSAAPAERLYMKRCSSLQYFMEYWRKQPRA